MHLSAFLSLAAAALVAADGHARHNFATTAAPDLGRRQGSDQCEEPSFQTVCPDGDGCCDIGEECTVEAGVPLCAGACLPGAETCTYEAAGVTACCASLGEACDPASPGFCTPTFGITEGPFPTPTFTFGGGDDDTTETDFPSPSFPFGTDEPTETEEPFPTETDSETETTRTTTRTSTSSSSTSTGSFLSPNAGHSVGAGGSLVALVAGGFGLAAGVLAIVL